MPAKIFVFLFLLNSIVKNRIVKSNDCGVNYFYLFHMNRQYFNLRGKNFNKFINQNMNYY